jgi:primosomal protein N' (replication factor Y)
LSVDYKLKEIQSINRDFIIPEKYINVAKWISEYYLCSLGEAISLFLPPDILHPRKSVVSSQLSVVSKNTVLTRDQNEILNKLVQKLKTKNNRPSLLHGVTGSGKTEVYIKLVEKVLRCNKQIIVLTPEIMLTPQIIEKFEAVFANQICLMHSGLSQSERFNSYRQFYNGEKKIIIGPRSALLVPSSNLGLIVIDEEQEDAYKQEKDPRYHAVDLAEQIAKNTGALLLLGSATPRIETYQQAVTGKMDLYDLKNRYQKLIMPTAQIVDLRNEIKNDNFSPISVKLQEKIKETLDNKKQIILFLNRRGMATFVSCRECGEVILCPRCSIPLIYHVYDRNNILNCHHCNYKTFVPAKCPTCNSSKIKFFGAGVDKIEKEIISLFPKARVRKVDSKSMQNKNDYINLHLDIKKHKIDILIGTQILAKGLDIPAVDLVGIISADTGLHLPYYKASEKVFSIITQVSGRSGRKNNVGQTIIQSYWPESNAILLAAKHDYKKFYESEIIERKKYGYPPFCHLVRVVAEDKNELKAKSEINEIASKLTQKNISFIGPAKCFLLKINNRFRYHLIIKINKLPNQNIKEIFKTNPYLVWDVDPIDLL